MKTPAPLTATILLIGCGNMGGALLAGWLKAGIPGKQIHVVEPDTRYKERLGTGPRGQGVSFYASVDEITVAPDIVLIALKPQTVGDLALCYARFFTGEKPAVCVSIAAGKTIDFFTRAFGEKTPVVRCMPNTPALIGKGMTGAYANAHTSDEHKNWVKYLFRATGEFTWVENEDLIDAVTALSGSGPAYMFLFLEALTKAGEKLGLNEFAAKNLAVHTMIGGAELANQSVDSLEQLRKNVTSPGGTTQAALEILMKNDAFTQLVSDAVRAAAERAKALSS